MKISLEERIRENGKKNRAAGKRNAGAGIAAYLKGNGKRFSLAAITLLFFGVYSSFSGFMSAGKDGYGLKSVSEEAKNIELAVETEIDLNKVDILTDKDVMLEGELGADYFRPEDTVEQVGNGIAETAGNQGTQIKTGSLEKTGKDVLEFQADDWRLILINQQHSIPDDYELKLGDVLTIKGVLQCDSRIIDDWLAMQKAAKKEGVALTICSPYRDYEQQKNLFNRKITRYMGMGMSYMEAYQMASKSVTVPNASEHQIGLALDIVTPSYTDLVEGFADTDAGKWLAKNSYQYGFILRYPKGKEFITGINYEPWHFRYVGAEAAAVIKEEDITLEEFWEEYL